MKEVWAHYNVSSDTIVLFRKVLHPHHNGRVVERQNGHVDDNDGEEEEDDDDDNDDVG